MKPLIERSQLVPWYQGVSEFHREIPRGKTVVYDHIGCVKYCQIIMWNYWHPTYKLKKVKKGNDYSELKNFNDEVLQGNVQGPFLYLLYSSDILITEDTGLATFADPTVIIGI